MPHLTSQVSFHIVKDTARAAHNLLVVLAAKPLEGVNIEVSRQVVVGRVITEGPVLARGNMQPHQLVEHTAQLGILGLLLGNDALVRIETTQFVSHGIRGRNGFPPEEPRGQIDHGDAKPFANPAYACQEVVLRGVEHATFCNGARRHNPRDFAANNALGCGRIFHLVADGHLESGTHHLGKIAVECVVRNATHGCVVAFRERDIQRRRGGLRVIEEHLVEVAETEEEDHILRHLALDAPVLAHHRCQFLACHVLLTSNIGH